MRNIKDRRKPAKSTLFPGADNCQGAALSERRKRRERRVENLALEERQTLLSEMPWTTPGNKPDKSD
jgi:hypothetical protein